MKAKNKLFKNLKVVELASVLAGPAVGYFFAELGAKVTKIENKKTGGDVTRSWKLPEEEIGEKESAYFYSVNNFKKHIFLDLTDKMDHKKCLKLIEKADIVICNFKKGDDKKLKLDFVSLKKINPKLIHASINGFGEDSDRVAYDLILQAESGFMSINGEENSRPLKMPVALIDILAAHQLKEAVLIALMERNISDKGKKVSVSLFDSAVASLANQATNWLVAGHLPKATGSLHPNIAPYGEIFFTKDKQQITFAIGSDTQFENLLAILQVREISKKYKTNQDRIKHRKELFELLQKNIQKIKFNEIYSACIKSGVPIGKIRNIKEVFELPEGKAMIVENKTGKHTSNTISSISFKGI